MPSFPLFSGGGSVLSVGLSLPGEFIVSGSPVTTSGVLTATLAAQAANTIWSGPSAGGAAVPGFRGLVAADLPDLSGIYQPLNGNLTSIAGLTTAAFGLDLLTKVSAAAVRSYIGAGSSSFSGAFADLTGVPTTLTGYGITDAQPLDADLTAISALTTTSFGRSLLTQANGAAVRSAIGAGTSSFSGAFTDLTGIPTTLSGYGIIDAQPLDSDLTAIAALTTLSFGRGLLTQLDAAAVRSYIGAGSSSFSGAFSSLTGIPTTIAGYGLVDAQPLDSDLTAIAALTTVTFGRSLLTAVDAAGARTLIGAGTSSFAGTFAALTGKPTTLSGYGITDGLATGLVTASGLTMNTARILGRTTAAAGAVEELTAGTSLLLASGSLNTIQDIQTTASPVFVGLTTTGDAGLGGAIVAGTRLRIKGAGSTSATNALEVSNLAGTALFRIDNNGLVTGNGYTTRSGVGLLLNDTTNASGAAIYNPGSDTATQGITFLSVGSNGFRFNNTGSATGLLVASTGIISFPQYGLGLLQSSAAGVISSNAAIATASLTMSTARILGRTTAATGAIEELTVGTSLSLASGSLNTIQGITTASSPTFAGLTSTGTLVSGVTGTTAGFIKLWGAAVAAEGNIYNDATYGIHMDTNSNARPIKIDGSLVYFSANVGIGVSPDSTYRLHVRGSGTTSAAYALVLENSVASTLFYVDNAGSLTQRGSSALNGAVTVGVGGAGIGQTLLTLNGSSATNYGPRLTFQSAGTDKGYIASAKSVLGGTSDGLLLYSVADGIQFYTAGTERMRIDSAGSVGIGVAPSSAVRVLLYGSDTTSSNYAVIFRNSVGSNTFYVRNDGFAGFPQINNWTTASAANLYTDGTGVYKSTSSARYKTNIQDYSRGLADLLKLRPVSYKGKNQVDAGSTFAGLLAEEVHAAGLTEFVEYDKDGRPDALRYSQMVALLINAVKELAARNYYASPNN